MVIGRLQEVPGTPAGAPGGVGAGRQRFPKQGRKSVGVARQYCERLGKVANCQAGMFLVYVSPLGRALVDKRLYLPESWTSDADRCAAAGAPEERRSYRSKTELALEMLGRAQERSQLPAGWVARDDAFGMSPSFREGLAALGMRYVLDVPAGFTVWPPEPEWTGSGRSGARSAPQTQAQGRAAPDFGGAQCRIAGGGLAGDHGGGGQPGSPQLPVQRPAGAADQPAAAWRNPLGRLPPEPGRQRAPLLPVQRSGGHFPGDSGLRGRVAVGALKPSSRSSRAMWASMSTKLALGRVGITTSPCACWAGRSC